MENQPLILQKTDAALAKSWVRLVIVLAVVAAYFALGISMERNDDAGVLSLLRVEGTSSFAPYTFWTLWAWGLNALYQLAPDVQWYSMVSYLLVVVITYLLSSILFAVLGSRHAALLLALGVALLCFYALSFTTLSLYGIVVCSGSLLLGVYQHRAKMVAVAALLLLCILVRVESFYLAVPTVAVIAFGALLLQRLSIRQILRRLGMLAIPASLAFVLFMGMYGVSSDKKDFVEYARQNVDYWSCEKCKNEELAQANDLVFKWLFFVYYDHPEAAYWQQTADSCCGARSDKTIQPHIQNSIGTLTSKLTILMYVLILFLLWRRRSVQWVLVYGAVGVLVVFYAFGLTYLSKFDDRMLRYAATLLIVVPVLDLAHLYRGKMISSALSLLFFLGMLGMVYGLLWSKPAPKAQPIMQQVIAQSENRVILSFSPMLYGTTRYFNEDIVDYLSIPNFYSMVGWPILIDSYEAHIEQQLNITFDSGGILKAAERKEVVLLASPSFIQTLCTYWSHKEQRKIQARQVISLDHNHNLYTLY